jgi:hypothetical protein
LVTVTLGAQKLSRTVSKDAVTSPIRAPFAYYAGTAGPAEVHEETRHSSQLRHSLGELLTCPFCLDVWVATAFVIGLILVPRLTRLIAGSSPHWPVQIFFSSPAQRRSRQPRVDDTTIER